VNKYLMLVAKIAGGAVFVASLGVAAAQAWSDPAFVLPPSVRFELFVTTAVLGGLQLILPRPGEPSRTPPDLTSDRHAP
jgi:hypothetical protein